MSRPIRLEFDHATYHVTSRGDRREAIYEDDEDRCSFLALFGQVVEQFNWICHGYCLMDNHYHLLIETPDGNLSKGMRQLNGVYTQSSNRRHQRSGHLFQGRYKAILVDADAYLLELTRYVVLNPVRAGMVKRAIDWPWSSYQAMVGKVPAPRWLATDGLLSQFSKKRKMAIKQYIQFVIDGIGGQSIWSNLNRQVFLGDDQFIQDAREQCEALSVDVNIPGVQRRSPAASLQAISKKHKDRNAGIIEAYNTGEYSYQEIATHYDLHFTTIGTIVRA